MLICPYSKLTAKLVSMMMMMMTLCVIVSCLSVLVGGGGCLTIYCHYSFTPVVVPFCLFLVSFYAGYVGFTERISVVVLDRMVDLTIMQIKHNKSIVLFFDVVWVESLLLLFL